MTCDPQCPERTDRRLWKPAGTGLAVLLVLTGPACGTHDPTGKESPMPALDLHSPAFERGAAIPSRFTCDGEDTSPPLQASPGPEGTASFALIVDDPDAPGGTWVHWLVWNLNTPSLPEGASGAALPEGAVEGTNSWGRRGYGGPCPPSGTHRYFFRLYALDTRLSLPVEADVHALRKAMEGHVLAEGEWMGTYSRQRK